MGRETTPGIGRGPDPAEARGPGRRRAQTRQRLLQAAHEVIAEQGLGSTTVEEVCARAGFSRGAFYSNFRTLDELFLAVWEAQAAHSLARLRAALDQADPAEPNAPGTDAGAAAALVRRGVEEFLRADDADDRDRWLVSTEFLLYAARRPQVARELDRQWETKRQLLCELLEDALARAGLEPVTDVQVLAMGLMAVHEGVQRPGQLLQGTLARQDIERWMLLPLVNGLTRPVADHRPGQGRADAAPGQNLSNPARS